jgi:hypothetical protein
MNNIYASAYHINGNNRMWAARKHNIDVRNFVPLLIPGMYNIESTNLLA